MDAELILTNFSRTHKLLRKGHYGVSGMTLGKGSVAKPGLLQSPGLHGRRRTDSTLFLDCHMHTMAQAFAHRHRHGHTHTCKRIFKRQGIMSKFMCVFSFIAPLAQRMLS